MVTKKNQSIKKYSATIKWVHLIFIKYSSIKKLQTDEIIYEWINWIKYIGGWTDELVDEKVKRNN